ncbi:hypothetical protein ACQ86G_12515 [Roseateles chitinivorans]|uniref:hypothetical protein n=1 Tax=Roseateles chitinivorans TaxID=2917965 RepID=UPI003D6738D7
MLEGLVKEALTCGARNETGRQGATGQGWLEKIRRRFSDIPVWRTPVNQPHGVCDGFLSNLLTQVIVLADLSNREAPIAASVGLNRI